MNRRRLGLLVVLGLLAAALVVGARDRGPQAPTAVRVDSELTSLRAAAALAPCPPGLGAGLPDVTLACVGAPGTVRLSAAGSGRPALVNIWATWCGPCVKEVPVLEDFARRAAGRVDLVGVLHQDTSRNALLFAEDASLGVDMTYPSVDDPDGVVLRRFGSGPPVTLFVTAGGEVAHVERGAVRDAAELDALVARHLGVAL